MEDAIPASTERKYKVLYLFSGPRRQEDGFERQCQNLGIECTCIDIEYDASHNLLDQAVWERIEKDLPDYDGFLITPPCSTFTAARSAGGKGPKPLRGIQGKDRYGLKTLKPHQKEKVKEGTLLALRGHGVAKFAQANSKPWIVEQPHWRPGQTSMYMLDEYMDLAISDDVAFHTFDQCRFGVEFEKKTDLLSNIRDMECFEVICCHPRQMWVIPWSGAKYFSSHPPLKGKQVAIPVSMWLPSMLEPEEPEGEFLTRKTAAYSAQMNKQLALVFHNAFKHQKAPQHKTEDPASQDLDVRVHVSIPLHGETAKVAVDDSNSLRSIHKWINPTMKYIGKQAMNIMERKLNAAPELETKLLDMLGHTSVLDDDIETMVSQLRTEIADLLYRNRPEGVEGRPNLDMVCNESCSTVIRAHLLHFWAQCVQDPGKDVVPWLIDGAPAGLTADTSELDAVCPKVDSDDVVGIDVLSTDFENFSNYAGVEDNEEALAAIQSYTDKGYLKRFDTLSDLREHLGAEPVLSKLGCIVKSKLNVSTGITTTKTRIILDCRRSQVSSAASRTHKSVLPRISDAIQHTLAMLADCHQGEHVTLLVADIVDAFWLIPLKVAERRFFCAKLRGKFYCFERTAQGSRAAPLTFAAIIAVASRWIQSLVSTPFSMKHNTEEARLQTYVDDPLFAIRGSEERRKRLAAVILLGWSVMGFPLAFHKAILSDQLTWIGVDLHVGHDSIQAIVPEAKVVELRELLSESLRENVLPKKKLRTIIGKAMSIASVLYCWRPFIQEMYTALYAEETHAPSQCVWVKQIRHTFLWVLTFLNGEHNGIVRTYCLHNYQLTQPLVTITWDASPYGLGGTLEVDGVFIEYFAVKISSQDEIILETQSGKHEGQQTWEALAGLVSLRLWSRFWKGQRAKLQIRADNVGSLVVLTALKGGSKQLALIAREYALDLGQAQWRPDVVTHIPGISNVTCDVLSRKFDPNKTFQLPSCLSSAVEVNPPDRSPDWWKTLAFERQFSAPIASNQRRLGAESSNSNIKRRRI